MFFQRFQCIGRASGLIPAIESNPWAENQPVGAHRQRRDMGKRRHEAYLDAREALGKGRDKRLFSRAALRRVQAGH
ncbi:hypothetical protein CLV88_10284 [Shimia abyssi]|uniref:Uncharacterized protein n=1 Tax=Shimia abyssi TaxID=1662395 RepID=A0A2P8FGY6_9RHOB|nr:hypothetical protein CLV88_10284 [Shimia abyssi]